MPLLSHPLARSAALVLVLVSVALPACAADGAAPARIVSIGGAVTEILFDLGLSDRIVAVDTTSTFPAEAAEKPDVGYMRQLSAEGVLSMEPDLVLAQEGSGPPDAVTLLKATVPFVEVPDTPSADGVAEKIRQVGAAVGETEKADALAARVLADFAALAGEVAALPQARPRVLFVLSLSGGRVMAAGADTSADAAIRLAGGTNAATGFSGFKPMVDEAVIAAAPDVVVVMGSGNHAVTADDLFALPAFQTTPAAADRAMIAMDGLFLIGFGPRAPEAARQLASRLHPGRIAAADAP